VNRHPNGLRYVVRDLNCDPRSAASAADVRPAGIVRPNRFAVPARGPYGAPVVAESSRKSRVRSEVVEALRDPTDALPLAAVVDRPRRVARRAGGWSDSLKKRQMLSFERGRHRRAFHYRYREQAPAHHEGQRRHTTDDESDNAHQQLRQGRCGSLPSLSNRSSSRPSEGDPDHPQQ